MDNLRQSAEPVRITEQEAAAMVELHARLNARPDSGPTVRDVAEVLHISEAEALALFNQVRAEQTVALPGSTAAMPKVRRWLVPASAAFIALLALFVWARSWSPAGAETGLPADLSPNPPAAMEVAHAGTAAEVSASTGTTTAVAPVEGTATAPAASSR